MFQVIGDDARHDLVPCHLIPFAQGNIFNAPVVGHGDQVDLRQTRFSAFVDKLADGGARDYSRA